MERQIITEEIVQKAYELRKKGRSYADISLTLNVSYTGIYNKVSELMKKDKKIEDEKFSIYCTDNTTICSKCIIDCDKLKEFMNNLYTNEKSMFFYFMVYKIKYFDSIYVDLLPDRIDLVKSLASKNIKVYRVAFNLTCIERYNSSSDYWSDMIPPVNHDKGDEVIMEFLKKHNRIYVSEYNSIMISNLEKCFKLEE